MNKSDLVIKLETMTLDEIGKEVGMSRQGVHYHVKKYGLKIKKEGSFFNYICDTCGKSGTMFKSRFYKSKKHFCSFKCYKDYLVSREYRDSRLGTAEVSKYA